MSTRNIIEMQVVNPKDVDVVINQIAGRIRDPRGAKWMRRMGRHMLLNMDVLHKEPMPLKPENRGGQRFNNPERARPSASHFDPSGSWVGKKPEEVVRPEEQEREDMRRRAEAAPRQRTESVHQIRKMVRRVCEGYETVFHRPVVQKEIDANFEKYKPAKGRAEPRLGTSPKLNKLEPWSQISHKERAKQKPPEGQSDEEATQHSLEKDSHYFKPFKTGTRQTIKDLNAVADWFNWLKPEDDVFKRLTAPASDTNAYREILRQAKEWKTMTVNEPWKLINDYGAIATHGNLSLRKMSLARTVLGVSNALAIRLGPGGELERRNRNEGEDLPRSSTLQPTKDWTKPIWCTKDEHNAKSYTSSGPLYMIVKDGVPWIQLYAQGTSSQASTPDNKPVTMAIAQQVAPLFNTPEALAAIQDAAEGTTGAGAIKKAVQALGGRRKAA